MNKAIAVMNTKGGVGKSTIVLALAETLSVYEGKSVLVIDSDAQASVSAMLMSTTQLYELQSEGLTLVEYLINAVLNNQPDDVKSYLVANVSDVDDAETVAVLPSDVQLTLFEREVSHEQRHTQLRKSIGALLDAVRPLFDVVLIDCPPSLSVLTESWLREADFHLTPTKADYISSCGLEVFRRFKSLNPEMGFAQNLGVVINMKDRMSPADDEYHKWLAKNPANRCFDTIIPRVSPLQDAAQFRTEERSYPAKYPGESGKQMRALVTEILHRIGEEPETVGIEPAAAIDPVSEDPNAGKPVAATPAITIAPEEPPIEQPLASAPANTTSTGHPTD
jgi:chromosome partitioning protein